MHDAGNGLAALSRRSEILRPNAKTPLLLTSLFVAAIIGCSERGSAPIAHESNLRMVAVLYNQYSSAHGGEAPRDANEFRSFVHSLGPGVLDRAGLSGPDELLTSHRDGKPFVIKYRREKWPLDDAIAYESEGTNGTRYLATKLGGVSEITEEQFAQRLRDEN